MGEGINTKIGYALGCLMDILFPKPCSCSVCGRILKEYSKKHICSGCISQLKKYINTGKTEDIFKYHEKGLEIDRYIDEVYSVCLYEGLGREMIHRLKYNDKRDIALTMAAMMEELLESRSFDIIVPVPISKRKLKKRGYNQTELISRELSDILDIPSINGIQRIKDTKSQVLLNEGMRWYNVKGAFRCDMDLKNKSVLLIDDVITTGATIYYCAKELKGAGAEKVTAISFAKSII